MASRKSVSSDVLARLERLESESAIVQTLYRYARAHYLGDLAMYLDCFTSDAVLTSSRNKEARGHAALAASFTSHTHAPTEYHKHVIVEPEVQFRAEEAVVESEYFFLRDGPHGPYIRSFGHYSDRLQKGEDGRWRLLERRITSEAIER